MEKYLKKLKQYENSKTNLLVDLDKILASIGLCFLKFDEKSFTFCIVMLFYLILRIKDLSLKKYYLNILKKKLIELDNNKNLTK